MFRIIGSPASRGSLALSAAWWLTAAPAAFADPPDPPTLIRTCGAPDPADFADRGDPSDCSLTHTNPAPGFDPSLATYRIPVVVHVIMGTGESGYLSPDRIAAQIRILNEDFRALPGSPGAAGTDTGIEFHLATVDPDGHPTVGYTYHSNDAWFDDSGNYFVTLAWDPQRYVNIYTLGMPFGSPGILGYVPALPQEPFVGTVADRIVIGYLYFGPNPPAAPFHLGRTTTHELGHYFGLYHTFYSGCSAAGEPGCFNTGDLICDTNPQRDPTFGCPANLTSCNRPAPYHNYLDFSDDVCMNNFTPQQARRMRCVLVNYRHELGVLIPTCLGDLTGDRLVGLDDLAILLTNFGSADRVSPGEGDFDGDEDADLADLAALLSNFGLRCP
jgi:Pregnancy-associated plasma protein-A